MIEESSKTSEHTEINKSLKAEVSKISEFPEELGCVICKKLVFDACACIKCDSLFCKLCIQTLDK